MRGLLMAACLACAATPALAQESYGVVGCGEGSTTPQELWDASLFVASTEIGPVEQNIAAAAASFSKCDGRRNGRWRFEGNVALVEDDFGSAQSALVGVGYQFSLGSNTSITPVVRVGYAAFDTIDDQVAAGVGVTFANSTFIGESRGAHATWLTFEWAPEYTSWQSADAGIQGLGFDDGVFSNFAAAGVSFPLSGALRGRFRLAQRYIDSEGPVSSIGSAIFTLGRDPVDGACNDKCWNVDLWLSKGDGDYESVLIGVSRPFGR